MNTLFTDAWKDFASIALFWKIIIILIVLAFQLVALIGVKNLYFLYKLWQKNKKTFKFGVDDKRKQSDLFNHPLFFTMLHAINHKIRIIDFGDKFRNKIFRTLLEVKITEITDENIKMLQDTQLMTISQSDFKALAFRAFGNIIDGYNREMKDKFGESIYNLIMQHPSKGFNVWNEPVIVYTRNLVEDICDSDLYCTNLERMYAILNAYHSATDATLVNVEKTFHGFNGELDELLKANQL